MIETPQGLVEFKSWPKTPRLNKDILVSEKIDGTNGAVIVVPAPHGYGDGEIVGPGVIVNVEDMLYLVAAQSRKRVITPEADNFGFAAWVRQHAVSLAEHLGLGHHYGEWWGRGIQRGYGLDYRKFSLFNIHRYDFLIGGVQLGSDLPSWLDVDLDVVPILYRGPFSDDRIKFHLDELARTGSVAAPGHKAEGIIVYHTASSQVYKVLIENDGLPKSLVK